MARLPQHPLPMTLTAEREASPVPQTHAVALKKREIMNAAKEQLEQQKKIEEEAAAAAAKSAVIISKAPVHLKPRDAFGGGSHLLQQQRMEMEAKEEKFTPVQLTATTVATSSPSTGYTPATDHVAIIRAQQEAINQEMQLLYQHFLSNGQPEHVARTFAHQVMQDRYKVPSSASVVTSDRPGSVPPQLLDSYRPPSRPLQQPPAAHTPDPFGRQSDSPLVPAHAHSRIPSTSPYVALPPDPYLHRADERLSFPPVAHRPLSLARNDIPAPTSPEPVTEFTLPHLESYPVVWQGFLGLKNEYATVQFHYVSGCKDLARASLPQPLHVPSSVGIDDIDLQMPTLRIGQRMRLEPCQLNGVQRKMSQAQEHCILLALPCGKDTQDVEIQSLQLRSHFITYLQLKGAAGIVNVAVPEGGDQAAYVVHVFPSCDFANETMSDIAPDLLARVAEIEHMVIIIATVFDNK